MSNENISWEENPIQLSLFPYFIINNLPTPHNQEKIDDAPKPIMPSRSELIRLGAQNWRKKSGTGIEGGKVSNKDDQAWQYTKDVEKWIWKQIRLRNIPPQDMEDVYQLCIIEVFNLMKRYNDNYSKVSWANFGIYKALKEYESTSGTIRLPYHVLEKMANLRKYLNEMDSAGLPVSYGDMESVTSMKLIDIMISKDRYAFQGSQDDDGNTTDFSACQAGVDESAYSAMYAQPRTAEEVVIANEESAWMYDYLRCLKAVEIFVLTVRYGLRKEKIPKFKEFRKGGSLSLFWYKKPRQYCLNDVGLRLKVTRERVRQIEQCALKKLKKIMCA